MAGGLESAGLVTGTRQAQEDSRVTGLTWWS